MTTREELSDAALRRLDAMTEAEERKQAMQRAHGEFVMARDAYTAAIEKEKQASRAHALIEQQLIQQRTEK